MGKGSTQARIVEPSGVALGGREHRTALALGAAQMPKLLVEAAAVLEAVHAARTEQPGESWYVADTRDRFRKEDRNPPTPGAKADARPVGDIAAWAEPYKT